MTVIGRPLSFALLVGALTFASSLNVRGLRFGLDVASAQPAAAPKDKPAAAPPAPDEKAAAPLPAPTPAQLEQAKKAFLAGKKLFDAKKYEPAVDKFKESYRLSRNPLLLYNLAFTLDAMGQKDLALFYYKKFLTDAPADAAQRAEATPRADVLEKELAAAPPPPVTPPPVTPPPVTPPAPTGDGAVATTAVDGAAAEPAESEPAPPKPTRPRKNANHEPYTAADFQHQIVEDAPPHRPLDLTAFSPDDSGWLITLYYRSNGEAKFHAVPMKPRYNELVGRVPAAKLTGVSIQYYIEVRTPDGKIVTRVGKPASPNIVYLDPKARARYYPDLEDGGDIGGRDVDYGGGGGGGNDGGGGGMSRGDLTGGYTDVGSTKFRRAKWIATGSAVGLLGVSVTFYLMAASMSSSLEAEAALANDTDECGTAPKPCRRFNDDRKAVEVAGQRNELVSRITFGIGLAATGAAAYLWYKEIKATKRGERTAAARKAGLDSLVAVPAVGDGFVGGTAALRF